MVADASTKKRPIAAASTAGTATLNTSAKRKKSPLADQPQNYYAPSKPMTKEELSAWRKEQRRERNRQSAAASRDKTRARIEELEGEVARWRHMYDDLRRKMANMERHIEFLSKFHPGAGGVVPGQPRAPVYPLPPPQQQMVTPPGSSPASPRTSPVGYAPCPQMTPTQGQIKTQPPVLPVVPALVPPPVKSSANSSVSPSHPSVTNPFPPLLSEPKHLVAMAVNGDTAETSCPDGVAIEEPKQHLIPISRQAVKNTGANAFGSSSAMSVPPSSTPRNQDPLVECKRVETSSTPGFKPVEVATGTKGVSAEFGVGGAAAQDAESHATGGTFKMDVVDGVDFRGSQPTQESSQDEDDAAFLDLLVDTLDGEFDPNLLI